MKVPTYKVEGVNTPANENTAIEKLRERSGISRNVEFGIEITERRPIIFSSPWSLCDGTRLKEAAHSGGFRGRPRHRFLTHYVKPEHHRHLEPLAGTY